MTPERKKLVALALRKLADHIEKSPQEFVGVEVELELQPDRAHPITKQFRLGLWFHHRHDLSDAYGALMGIPQP